MLCANCQALCSLIDPHQDKDFLHHETVKELRTSANLGCHLCKVIYGDIEGNLDKSVSISSKVAIKTRRDTGLEVALVEPIGDLAKGPHNNRKPPIIHVIFQSFSLPSKSSRP